MGRVWAMGVLGVVWGCLSVQPAEELQVDRVEDGKVTVIDAASGGARTVEAKELPPAVHEGDVIVDGRVDPVLTAELQADVQAARAGLRRSPLRSGDALGGERAGRTRKTR